MNAPVGLLRPAGMPAGTDPREWRKAARQRIEALLDASMRLIDALDSMEADCDLEDVGDSEPWLGWTERGLMAATDDLELDNSDDEDGGDGEDGGDLEADPAELGFADRESLVLYGLGY